MKSKTFFFFRTTTILVAASYLMYRYYMSTKKSSLESEKKISKTSSSSSRSEGGVFEKACEKIKNLKNLDTNIQLQFYGLFKQATQGKCNTEKPWASDFRGRAKWEAWSALSHMSKSEAEKEYVALLDRIAPGWRDLKNETSNENNHKKESQGMGLSVSTMKMNIEDEVPEGEEDVFVFCSKGETEKVLDLIRRGEVNINQKDNEMGMTLLHWACDRGHLDLIKSLLSLGANVNAKDDDGETPLGTARLCEHKDAEKLLLENGATE